MSIQPASSDLGHYRIIRESNKIQLRFLQFPKKKTRDALKQRFWRWSPDEGCWWTTYSTDALQFVRTYWKPAQSFSSRKISKTPSMCSGKTGNGIVWQFITDTLFIFGFFGVAIPDVAFEALAKSPWYSLRNQIQCVMISDGIERIGKRAFYGFTHLERISMGNTITSIGARAFSGCSNLSVVELSNSLHTIESQAFRDCSSIQELFLPATVNSIAADAFRGWSDTQHILQLDPNTQQYRKICYACTAVDLPSRFLAFGDFVVLFNKNSCIAKGHKIEDINAKIYTLGYDGSTLLNEIPAGYCQQCNQYFIETFQYEKLCNTGIPLCRVIKSEHAKATSPDYSKTLSEESILHQFGYNVSQEDNLSKKQRQTILACLIESGICNRHKITGHLSWLIRNNEGKPYMYNAISEWTEDRIFAENYHFGSCQIVAIRSLRIQSSQ